MTCVVCGADSKLMPFKVDGYPTMREWIGLLFPRSHWDLCDQRLLHRSQAPERFMPGDDLLQAVLEGPWVHWHTLLWFPPALNAATGSHASTARAPSGTGAGLGTTSDVSLNA